MRMNGGPTSPKLLRNTLKLEVVSSTVYKFIHTSITILSHLFFF